MTKLSCAVIGVGYLGRFHAQKFQSLANVNLLGVYDTQAAQAQQVAAELGVTAFSSLEELIEMVDAVSIAASTPAHFALAKACLSAGLHVLLEKPMTLERKQAEILNDLAYQHACVFQIGHLERLNPAYQYFSSYLEQPKWIDMRRLAPFKQRGSEVNVVLDLMVHDLDILLSWLNSPVIELKSHGQALITEDIDLADVTIRFANGCIAHLHASRLHHSLERVTQVYQAQDYYVLNFQDQMMRRYAIDQGLKLVHEEQPLQKVDALLLQIQSFVNSVLHHMPIIVDGHAGYRALDLALKIQDLIKIKESNLV